ncbi:MAG TPA: hypothetical protein VI485_25780 [Vicinamibacterales bacterium]|nr:hypothetical protein [Vicinamibacterales bacterium]
MISLLAVRSLTAHPVRSAVLAAGFGVGVAVMAILLGVAGIVLEQAQAPALAGGGDVLIRLSLSVPARLVLSGTLQSDALRPRILSAAASHGTDLYLLNGGKAIRVAARGGIPSLERALDDRETAAIAAWRDSPADTAWTRATPDQVLRQIDRFHGIPDAPAWANSWAEWLYFNGRSSEARFYLTFLVGPRTESGGRASGVRLQIERNGQTETFSGRAELTDAELSRAPDLAIGGSTVTLDGMRYRIHLDVADASGKKAVGDFTLAATPGRLVPPIEITGAQGWRTGYVVPVMSGALDGTILVHGTPVSLSGGTGYHDHNWGFWRGVSWQWGQAQQGDLSLIYGRVFPPREAADPETIPGFVGALGPDGPLGYSTDVRITEANDEQGRPKTITIRARGTALDLDMRFDVASAVTTRMAQGPLANGIDFLQLRGQYTVTGRAGTREIRFTAAGAAETFRGN